MGLTRCYETESFFTFIFAVLFTPFYAISISDTCLRSRKSISIPNFNKLFQSTAEIKLLPVYKNGQPSYWNSISGFDFDLLVVIDMSFCILLPNIVEIGRSTAEI